MFKHFSGCSYLSSSTLHVIHHGSHPRGPHRLTSCKWFAGGWIDRLQANPSRDIRILMSYCRLSINIVWKWCVLDRKRHSYWNQSSFTSARLWDVKNCSFTSASHQVRTELWDTYLRCDTLFSQLWQTGWLTENRAAICISCVSSKSRDGKKHTWPFSHSAAFFLLLEFGSVRSIRSQRLRRDAWLTHGCQQPAGARGQMCVCLHNVTETDSPAFMSLPWTC